MNGGYHLKRLMLYILFVSLSTTSGTVYATSRANSNVDADPLKFAHLIVKGSVVDVWYETITMADLGVEPKETFERIPIEMAILSFSVTESLKGAPSDSTISLLIKKEDSYLLEPGTKAILATYLNPYMGQYYIRGLSGVFIESNSQYVRQADLVNSSEQYISETIESTKLDVVSSAADVIAFGRIVGEDRVTKRSGERLEIFRKYTLMVESVLKGKVQDEQISFLVQNYGTRGSTNSFPIPMRIDRGDELYAFLKLGEHGLYAFAGCNGLFEVDGTVLYYDKVIPYHLNRNEFEAKIIQVTNQ